MLLARIWNGWVHLALGYATREAYARDRLGMDPTTARALVRLERAAALSEPFARTYRTGSLSAVKASVLLPLLSADPLGRFHHLRGVHAARLRCGGRAPDRLTWQMGIRPGAPPLATYRSGDVAVFH